MKSQWNVLENVLHTAQSSAHEKQMEGHCHIQTPLYIQSMESKRTPTQWEWGMTTLGCVSIRFYCPMKSHLSICTFIYLLVGEEEMADTHNWNLLFKADDVMRGIHKICCLTFKEFILVRDSNYVEKRSMCCRPMAQCHRRSRNLVERCRSCMLQLLYWHFL